MNNISYSTDEDDTYLQYNKDVKKKELDAAIEFNKLENEMMYKEDLVENENDKNKLQQIENRMIEA